MIETNSISYALLGRVFDIAGKKLFRWYRNTFSDFTDKSVQAKLHEYDTIDRDLINKKTKKPKVVLVPIFKPENFGPNMAIDDKGINGEGNTIISNKDTGKIAVLATTTKSKILVDILRKIPVTIRFSVKTVSCDLAEGYRRLSSEIFMNAISIADKFHVVKLGLEALQAVRIRYRQVILAAEREQREIYKSRERERRDQCQKTGEVYELKPNPRIYSKTLANGETTKELLARSRYLLFSFESEWTESQKERASILFGEFPEIKKAYTLVSNFRAWYRLKTMDTDEAREKLKRWYEEVGLQDIDEISSFASTVERHEGEILNYFRTRQTNAFAESLNAKIQALVRTNYGIRDIGFFHFRVMRLLS